MTASCPEHGGCNSRIAEMDGEFTVGLSRLCGDISDEPLLCPPTPGTVSLEAAWN